jgi:hypothetical protein
MPAWRANGLLEDYELCRRSGSDVNATAFRQWRLMVAGGGFEPPTFGLCDLTHLSMRVGLYLHPRGMLAIQSLRLPPTNPGAWFGIALSLARRRFHRL